MRSRKEAMENLLILVGAAFLGVALTMSAWERYTSEGRVDMAKAALLCAVIFAMFLLFLIWRPLLADLKLIFGIKVSIRLWSSLLFLSPKARWEKGRQMGLLHYSLRRYDVSDSIDQYWINGFKYGEEQWDPDLRHLRNTLPLIPID